MLHLQLKEYVMSLSVPPHFSVWLPWQPLAWHSAAGRASAEAPATDAPHQQWLPPSIPAMLSLASKHAEAQFPHDVMQLQLRLRQHRA